MLPTPDPSLVRALREDLEASGYSEQNPPWSEIADRALRAGVRQPAVSEMAERHDGPAVIAKMFRLGLAESVNAVSAAFTHTGVEGLQQLGLADPAADVVRPLVAVAPKDSEERWLASDFDEAVIGGALSEDHVLGVGGASRTLAGLQLPSRAGRVWDLGTGCGVQALVASKYVDEVVATDLSERAVAFARLNAELAEASEISVRQGDLFEPVKGEQFDRIVCNPPFVITPRVAGVPVYEYRDGRLAGDDLVESVIRGLGEHLLPGGVAVLLGNWESRGTVQGLQRVREWVNASSVPLDAWVVERESLDPLGYAQLWVRDGGTRPGSPKHDRLVTAWLADFAARDVTAIGFGYVVLRRPLAGGSGAAVSEAGGADAGVSNNVADATPTLARYERIDNPVRPETWLGAHIAHALGAHDALQELDDQQLAASVLEVAPDVSEARHYAPGDENPQVIELRQGDAFARVSRVDPGLAALVGACDGDLPVGVLIDAIAELLEVDSAALRADLLPEVRELVFTGFLRFNAG